MDSFFSFAEVSSPRVSEELSEPKPFVAPPAGVECPSFIDVEFAVVSHRPPSESSKAGLHELRIEGRNQAVTDEGLSQIMDFMDTFVWSESAKNGYCIVYDVRELQTPSMAIFMRVAEWGKVPERKHMWEKLNCACKIVVAAGYIFTLAKSILSTFFYICPPVCPTYLLTDPDEPEETAVCYRPEEKIQQEPGGASTAEGSSSDCNSSIARSPASSRSSSTDARAISPQVKEAIGSDVGEAIKVSDASEVVHNSD